MDEISANKMFNISSIFCLGLVTPVLFLAFCVPAFLSFLPVKSIPPSYATSLGWYPKFPCISMVSHQMRRQEGSLVLGLLAYEATSSFVFRATLWLVRCLATFLASCHHSMPIDPPLLFLCNCDGQKCLDFDKCALGDNLCWAENHWVTGILRLPGWSEGS